MEYAQAKKWIRDQAKKVADEWWIDQNKDYYSSFYLYFKNGDVKIAKDLPGEDWKLADPKRITGSKEQVFYFCFNALRQCPCLPIEEV